ncbi:Uncharacterised protein [Mycobacteroides abscessus]|nr:Uncharacterised protein [Mycobacteroides abscessus]
MSPGNVVYIAFASSPESARTGNAAPSASTPMFIRRQIAATNTTTSMMSERIWAADTEVTFRNVRARPATGNGTWLRAATVPVTSGR